MTVTLQGGAVLTPIMVTGEKRYVQGKNRDTLTFVFPGTQSMEALDAAFTETSCGNIRIVGNDESEAIHNGYIIRCEIKKTAVETAAATFEAPAVSEERIFVSMSQESYEEKQLRLLLAAMGNMEL